jgi:predicted esterase
MKLLLPLALATAGFLFFRHRSRVSAPARVPTGQGPLIVFFHGKGGHDATYRPILDTFGYDYILPHGYSVGGDRYEWWPMSSTTENEAKYAADVEKAAQSVLPMLEKLLATGRPILLTGHSQGGQLAATLAMKGVAPAVVASGWVPDSLVTNDPEPIVFVHGTEDPYAPFERTKELVEQLNSQGVDQVRFVPVQGAAHTFVGPLQSAWKSEVNKALS